MPRTRSALLVVLVAAVPVLSPARPTITSVKPTGGSLNGGTRVHIQVCVCVLRARCGRQHNTFTYKRACMSACMHHTYILLYMNTFLPSNINTHEHTRSCTHAFVIIQGHGLLGQHGRDRQRHHDWRLLLRSHPTALHDAANCLQDTLAAPEHPPRRAQFPAAVVSSDDCVFVSARDCGRPSVGVHRNL